MNFRIIFVSVFLFIAPNCFGRTTKLEKEQQRSAFWEVVSLAWRQSIKFSVDNNCIVDPELFSKLRASYTVIGEKISNQEITNALTSIDFNSLTPEECSRVLSSAVQMLINAIDPLPLPAKVPSLSKGQRAYMEYCASCHGDDGAGKGELSEHFLPNQVLLRRFSSDSFAPIYVYSTALTGIKGMPGFADKIGQDELWDLAFFVTSFIDTAQSSVDCEHLNIEMQQATLFDGKLLNKEFGASECQIRQLRSDVSNLNHERRNFNYSSVFEDPKFKKYGLILLGVFVFVAAFFTFVLSITRSRVK